MKRFVRLTLLSALTLAAAACGSREPLVPPPGTVVPKPAQAPAPPTTEEMLTKPDIAQPARQDDSLRRSEEREDDPFDLPPAG
jgi:predicted small lipoprotein YifL